jgi:hypothetical protein
MADVLSFREVRLRTRAQLVRSSFRISLRQLLR